MPPVAALPSGPSGLLRRLVHKADFERLLGSKKGWRSAHFAVHHVAARPTVAKPRAAGETPTELSTDSEPAGASSVDNLSGAHWLGVVVPKRHARRSVTRSLVKRQMRAALSCHAQVLPGGQWLLRLRQPLAVREFPSAASQALARAVREELNDLLGRVARSSASRAAEGSLP
jgi:ribonuclease P protein component